MPFVMADDGLFAAPNDRGGPPQFPRRQREERLHAQVLAAAEGTADRRVAHDDLVFAELQYLCDLFAIFVQPLPGRFDHEFAVFVVRDTGVRLEIGVFLPRRFERFFDDDCGSCERGVYVAFSNAHVLEHVAAAILVYERRGRRHRGARIEYSGQLFVRDGDEFCGCLRSRACFGDDECDTIARVTHDVLAQQRLIFFDESIPVVRHVGRGEHPRDARMSQRRAGVYRDDSSARPMREYAFEMQHAGPHEIGRITRRTRDFVDCVGPRKRFADERHVAVSTAVHDCIASRIFR